MKFISEIYDSGIETIIEESTKSLYIKGPFAQMDTKNRNRRIYPKSVMESALNDYDSGYISKNRALGEMSHPQNRLSIDPERACILVNELHTCGNDILGKAKVLQTPMGNVLRGLIQDGVSIGVSSRGAGSVTLKEGVNYVGNDFRFAAFDVVSDPSCAIAFVNGIMESTDNWVWDESLGVFKLEQIDEQKKHMKKMTNKEIESSALALFENYLNIIKK